MIQAVDVDQAEPWPDAQIGKKTKRYPSDLTDEGWEQTKHKNGIVQVIAAASEEVCDKPFMNLSDEIGGTESGHTTRSHIYRCSVAVTALRTP